MRQSIEIIEVCRKITIYFYATDKITKYCQMLSHGLSDQQIEYAIDKIFIYGVSEPYKYIDIAYFIDFKTFDTIDNCLIPIVSIINNKNTVFLEDYVNVWAFYTNINLKNTHKELKQKYNRKNILKYLL